MAAVRVFQRIAGKADRRNWPPAGPWQQNPAYIQGLFMLCVAHPFRAVRAVASFTPPASYWLGKAAWVGIDFS